MYVVWSPQRGATEANVAEGTTLIPDGRVRHFWDGELRVGEAFAPIVGSTEPAWDVWMLFGPEARWDQNQPPVPDWWEHQLGGLPRDRHLDASRFARTARALEAGTLTAPVGPRR